VRIASIILNATTTICGSVDAAAGGTFGNLQQLNCIYQLAVNDYLEVAVYQDSGGSRNVVASSPYSPAFWAHRLPSHP
jgi:hypothetical protein